MEKFLLNTKDAFEDGSGTKMCSTDGETYSIDLYYGRIGVEDWN